MNTEKKVELLAPGGSVEAVKAAILANADAVYCGLPMFNARNRADTIPAEQLAGLVTIAHQHGCKIYLTLNTLVLDQELTEVLSLLDGAYRSGIDAVIVADWGLLTLVREQFPQLDVHASARMTTHNGGQIALLGAAGVTQVNLCRELSLAEVTALCALCVDAGMVPEVVVHGALCVSFSGHCFMSSAVCGRSGNRGDCSQPCRRMYTMRGGGRRPLFNLKDSSVFASAGALVEAGVGSFKIEGRMKSFRYVHTVVSAWRKQITRFYSGEPLLSEEPALATVFNRSFCGGYLDGRINGSMFTDDTGDLSLVKIGEVYNFTADTLALRLDREVAIDPETPVRIYTAGFTFVCTGFLDRQTGRFEYRLRITHKLKGKINRGDIVYRMAGEEGPPDLRDQVRRLTVRKLPLHIAVSGTAGHPLSARCTSGERSVTVASEIVLGCATSRELSKEIIAEKMGLLGETEFELSDVDCSGLAKGLFLPLSSLNDLRRRAVAELSGRQAAITTPRAAVTVSFDKSGPGGIAPSLAVLVDDEADLALQLSPSTKLLFELPVAPGERADHYAALFKQHPSLIPWFPAILIGENFTSAVSLLETLHPPLVVADNTGIGRAATNRGIGWIAGPLCGCANSMTLRALAAGGCVGACLSAELGRNQLAGITAPVNFSRWFTLFAPQLLMNTRQCIIRNCTDCGTPEFDNRCLVTCEKTVELLDDNKQPLYVVKRPGWYTQVYGGYYYFNPDVLGCVDNDNAVFLIDLRRLPSKTTLTVSRQELLSAIERSVAGRDPAGELQRLATHSTIGNYLRGW